MLPENEHNMAREFFLALDVEVHGRAAHFIVEGRFVRAQVPWVKVCEASGYEGDAKSPEEVLKGGERPKKWKDVTFTELIAATFDRKRGLSEKMCRAAYQSFDKSGDRQALERAIDQVL